MANVILVHGAAANEKSWFDVPATLRAEGHDVTAIRLPGHSVSLLSRPSPNVTMDDYIARVEAALPDTGNAVLVGHSMGGFTVAEVASRYPGRVSRSIYVTAMLPSAGDSPATLIAQAGTGIDDVLTEFLSHGLVAIPALSRQPKGPMTATFSPSAGFPSVPRTFLRCDADGILPNSMQSAMIDAWPGTAQVTLDSDHLPQLSAEEVLVDHLLGAIDT